MKQEAIINKQEVLDVVRDALMAKVGNVINAYNSPLDAIIRNVITENEDHLTQIIRKALELSFKDKKFVDNVNEEFKHKIAKVLVGKMEGAVEKAAEKLRADPALRARLILAIEEMIR